MGGKAIDQRIAVLTFGFGLLLTALTCRLYYLQIIQHQRLLQLASRQQERTIDIQPARGRIYDRQGRLLAFNRQCSSFFAVPSEIEDAARTAKRLSPLVGLSPRMLEKKLRQRGSFVWIKRKASEANAAAIIRLALPGIHRLAETQRVYPEGRLACHILGFVGLDNQGLDGIELQYDQAIRGTTGWMRVARDARGHIVETASQVIKAPEAGQDVVLTLDSVIQHIAERELAKTVEKYRAKAGSVVVLDPASGEILALANLPNFDPNAFARFSSEARRNRAIRDVYEPGSTFKLVTAAAGLQEGVVAENSVIDCEQGSGKFAGRTVRDHIPYGRISFRDVFAFSSNIGTVKVGQRLGAARLVRYANTFGFGRPTGIELPGEAAGLLKAPERWKTATMASVPYGQEVAVTTLQSAMAYAAVANEGWLSQPTLIRELRRSDGTATRPERAEVRRQAVAADVAHRLRVLLQRAVDAGTGTEAQIPHYPTAGKTGTAQKPLAGRRGYDPVNCIASFIGFIPADQPKLLIAVMIDSPQGLQWGGLVAGPVFKEIGQNLVAYLGILPATGRDSEYAQVKNKTEKRQIAAARPAPAPLVRVPDLAGLDPQACRAALQQQGLRAEFLGRGGRIKRQRPASGTQVAAGSPITAYLGDKVPTPAVRTPDAVVVPNLAGQSLRNALQVLAAYGLQARVSGSGVVRAQSLRPFTQARLGAVCSLDCKDPEVFP